MEPTETDMDSVDVVVLGGALSGAAAAYLLKKKRPGLSVRVIERSGVFSRRVGEATVEISSYFLTRVLGLTEYLNQEHLNKQGLRFWFHKRGSEDADACSEVGPGYNVRIPSFQVDRARMDEEVLRRAVEAGAELVRPAEVKAVDLMRGGLSTVTYVADGQTTTLRARWVVDATGVAKFLARKNGWVRPNDAHPISSIWSRFQGVACLDDPEMRTRLPGMAGRGHGTRFTATNHLVGDGWWSWWIPLKGGDMSVGVVYDERIAHVPPGRPGERLRALLETHPLARELLRNAEADEDDLHYRKNLPYVSQEIAGDGFVLVGDAAGFMDPFYSPGMDWISFGVCAATNLIMRERLGRPTKELAERVNADFKLSYERWFISIYKDKYFYMGDYELMLLAFRLDLGLYYLGVVSQPYKRGWQGMFRPAFTGPSTNGPYRFIRLYNRRLANIARSRRARGTWGRRNTGEAFMFNSYTLDWKLPVRLLFAFASWGSLELREGWRTWFRVPADVHPQPIPEPKTAMNPP